MVRGCRNGSAGCVGGSNKSSALSVAGLRKGPSGLECTCFDQPLLIRGAKSGEGFYPDVRVSWYLGQLLKSCLGHGGAGGRVGEAVVEGDRRFAEGGTGMKIQCSGWNRAALPRHANFSIFILFSLLEYVYFLVFTPLLFLRAPQVISKGLPAGFG